MTGAASPDPGWLETAEDRPAAEQAFGEALPAARAYARLLAGEGITWGLLGPREIDRVWRRHLLNSVALAPFIPTGADVLDVGSGAGLPGIPLRLARPDLRITLLEPLQRRVRFLELCRQELRLPDLIVLAVRAEAAAGEHDASVVTARAVAPLQRLIPAAWPLVRPGGQLLAIKGQGALAELRACPALPADLQRPPEVVSRYHADGEPLVTVVRFRRSGR